MPRLKAGELASSVELRSQASTASAEARVNWLLELEEKKLLSSDEAAAFATFSSLCEHVDVGKGIHAISPKTLRKHIESSFEGGHRAFRNRMKRMLDRSDGSDTRAGLNASNDIVEPSQIDAVLEMTARYSDLLERFSRLRKELPKADIELRAHFRVFPDSPGYLKRIK
jgi:hypothetical protein